MKFTKIAICVLVLLAAGCTAETIGTDTAGGGADAAVSTRTTEPETVATSATAEPNDPPPTSAPTVVPVSTAVPTTAPEPTPSPEPPATPTPIPGPQGPCDAGSLASPDPDRPRYEVSVSIDPAARTMTGTMMVTFTPDLAIDELVMRLWPNGPRPATGGVTMTIDAVVVDGGETDPVALSPTLIEIPLPASLDAGESVELSMDFAVTVPLELRSRLSGRDDYMRLGTAFPILPWQPGVGWATDPPTSLFAEAVLSPVADWSVQIEVPDGFDVLASGVPDTAGIWRLESGRDFAISVGRFRVVTGVAMAPEPVTVTVGAHETVPDDPQLYLDKVVDSLEQFSERWGQYPWPSLSLALTPNLSGGIEFPTHIMQGPNTIGRTTSHEVGHMFFYSLVGNNQGAEPWLDEGITSYAEFTYEGVTPGTYPIPRGGVGRATEPMEWFEQRSDIYYRSVYSQTGFALQRLGSQETVDCALARFVASNAHQIATAQDFVTAFRPDFPNIVEDLAALGVVIDE